MLLLTWVLILVNLTKLFVVQPYCLTVLVKTFALLYSLKVQMLKS